MSRVDPIRKRDEREAELARFIEAIFFEGVEEGYAMGEQVFAPPPGAE